MARLIDADALRKALLKMRTYYGRGLDYMDLDRVASVKDVWLAVEKIPTIDLAPRQDDPVPPEREYSGGGTTWWHVCGACRTAIDMHDKYCRECGRKVRWE